MAADGSKGAVAAAIGGNTLVMIAKFTGFAVTGSGAMLSEAIHTLADVMNQILLLVGIVRSGRAPDERFRYGFNRERFVWALISAVGIFFLGCGVTLYHGISALLDPHPVGDLGWAVVVLIFALVVEGIVLWIAYRGLKKAAGDEPFMHYLKHRADPSAVAVLLEDAAACLGVLIAMGSIALTRITGSVYWDAIGSILIGLLLGWVAVWLIRRNRELLVGPRMPDEARQALRELLARRRDIIEELVEMKSRMIDTETWDVTLTVEFGGRRLAERLEPELRAAHRELGGGLDWEAFRQFAERYSQQVVDALGEEIDALEAEIQAAVPQIKHIDVEPH